MTDNTRDMAIARAVQEIVLSLIKHHKEFYAGGSAVKGMEIIEEATKLIDLSAFVSNVQDGPVSATCEGSFVYERDVMRCELPVGHAENHGFAPFKPTPPVSAEGPTPMVIDKARRWEAILEISKRVAYKDGTPTEVESALCGAVIRVREFAEEIVRLRAELSARAAAASELVKDLNKCLRDVPETSYIARTIKRAAVALQQAEQAGMERAAKMHDEASKQHHDAGNYAMAAYEGSWAGTFRTAAGGKP